MMVFKDFRPTASLSRLQLRAQILAKVRNFFTQRGFLEVETPLLSADTVVDRHLDPICVDRDECSAEFTSDAHILKETVTSYDESHAPHQVKKSFFMQTSPEFCMKRLVAAGYGPVFQICKAFRKDEIGRLHNPEFTMLEWYNPGDDMNRGMDLLDDVQQVFLNRGTAVRISYEEAFLKYVGIHPMDATLDEIQAEILRRKIPIPPDYQNHAVNITRDDWLDILLVECVQPMLGKTCPVILYDYPASQAALAVIRGSGKHAVAERFELYADGIELANGYHELCDPHELMRRNRLANALRRMDGKRILPDESRLLDAMRAGFPSCSGTALGVDRAVMIAAGAENLADVMAFPFHIA